MYRIIRKNIRLLLWSYWLIKLWCCQQSVCWTMMRKMNICKIEGIPVQSWLQISTKFAQWVKTRIRQCKLSLLIHILSNLEYSCAFCIETDSLICIYLFTNRLARDWREAYNDIFVKSHANDYSTKEKAIIQYYKMVVKAWLSKEK